MIAFIYTAIKRQVRMENRSLKRGDLLPRCIEFPYVLRLRYLLGKKNGQGKKKETICVLETSQFSPHRSLRLDALNRACVKKSRLVEWLNKKVAQFASRMVDHDKHLRFWLQRETIRN